MASAQQSKHHHLPSTYIYPHESLPHKGTLMAWPITDSISPSSNITATRTELATIARTISRYEPVELFVHHDDISSARKLLAEESAIHIHPTSAVFSLWARDTGPLWVRNQADGTVLGVLTHFNNWGAKLPVNSDAETAPSVLETLGVESISASFVAEGGGLELDGDGTLLATESCLLNDNRNHGLKKKDLEGEFARLFGVEKTIWCKGSKGLDITDSHIDALARFVEPGVVLLSRPRGCADTCEKSIYEDARRVLMKTRDARGRAFSIVEISEPENHKVQEGERQDFGSELCVSYLNYYVCNGAVIMAKFGDEKADREAKETIEKFYPDRVVEQVALRELAKQGGGIHCATQQILA